MVLINDWQELCVRQPGRTVLKAQNLWCLIIFEQDAESGLGNVRSSLGGFKSTHVDEVELDKGTAGAVDTLQMQVAEDVREEDIFPWQVQQLQPGSGWQPTFFLCLPLTPSCPRPQLLPMWTGTSVWKMPSSYDHLQCDHKSWKLTNYCKLAKGSGSHFRTEEIMTQRKHKRVRPRDTFLFVWFLSSPFRINDCSAQL